MTAVRWLILTAMVALAGCSGSKPPATARVSGTITLDGRPVETGTVMLFGPEGAVPRELKISNGAFEGEALVGQNRVQFAVYKRLPGADLTGPAALDVPAYENILPPQHAGESQIFWEVKGGGPNVFSHDLRLK